MKVPEGDVLIHAGDLTNLGEEAQYKDIAAWFGELPHKYKIFTAGNHDFAMNNHGLRYLLKHAIYLEDTYVEIEDVLFYGSPYTKKFGFWAYMEHEGELSKRFKRIPYGTNVLITHGPPYTMLDQVIPNQSDHLGSQALEGATEDIPFSLHVFGHVHGSGGLMDDLVPRRRFVNASVLNEAFQVAFEPQVVEI